MPQSVESPAPLLEHFTHLKDPRAEPLLEHGLLATSADQGASRNLEMLA